MRQRVSALPGKRQIRVGSFLLFLLLCVSLAFQTAFAGDGLQTQQVMVVDNAGLLSEEEEAAVLQEAQQLADQTGWDVRVLTVKDAGGRKAVKVIEDFMADHFSNENAVGFLIDMDNRESRIATLGDARYYLTDARQDIIWDGDSKNEGVYPYLKNARYARAFALAMQYVGYWYKKGIDSGTYLVDTETGEITEYKRPKSLSLLEGLIGGIVGIFSGLGFAVAVTAKYHMKSGKYKYQPHEHSEMQLRVKQDTFVRRFVTQRRIRRESSGGGHSGGGSSVHSGSGGHSFGGSGRSF